MSELSLEERIDLLEQKVDSLMNIVETCTILNANYQEQNQKLAGIHDMLTKIFISHDNSRSN